jgi:APA family basic amino acid/polyamine antiporter
MNLQDKLAQVTSTEQPPARTELPRQLSFIDAASIVVGIIIGAGIFLVPSLVAQSLPSAPWIIAVWVVSGILSFCGALAFAEMGAMIPATGGQYVFLREAFGPLPAFLCGWTFLVVSMTASMAWLAVSFCRYLGYFMHLPEWGANIVGCTLVIVLTWINYRGVVLGAWVQKIFTGAKLVGIFVLIVAAFLSSHTATASLPLARPIRFGDFGVAMIACLLAYDGWVNMSFVAGEIRDPKRNILRALLAGVALVMVVYISANVAYLSVLSPDEIAHSERVGADVADRALGTTGGAFISATILLSIIGSLNGRFLTQARVYFAQAQDGLFFKRFAAIHPVYKTPGFSLWMQAALSVFLILTGSWNFLIDYAMPAIWVTYAVSVAGVIALRRKMPNAERPYKMWGYPVTPVLFVIAAVAFVVNSGIEKPGPTLTALGLILLGVPAYFFWRKR